MAMMASKGAVDEELEGRVAEVVRSDVLDDKRSPAPREEVVVDWIWEAE